MHAFSLLGKMRNEWSHPAAGSAAYQGTLTQQSHPRTPGRQVRQEWAEAYDAQHQGFYEHQTLKISRQEPDAKILGTTTRKVYKTVNGQFTKRKVRLCAMGNQ